MSFTKRFEKALRRKKRSNRPGAEPITRMQVRHMTKRMADDHKAFACIVPTHGTLGVWVWREGDRDFLVAGELTSLNKVAMDRIMQAAPDARIVTPQEFQTRTRHVRVAMDTNGHTKERN